MIQRSHKMLDVFLVVCFVFYWCLIYSHTLFSLWLKSQEKCDIILFSYAVFDWRIRIPIGCGVCRSKIDPAHPSLDSEHKKDMLPGRVYGHSYLANQSASLYSLVQRN